MAKRERVLVVVEPGLAAQPAFERAARVAGPMGWSIELLACAWAAAGRSGDARTRQRQVLAKTVAQLEDLAKGRTGLQIEIKAVWDRPLHEAIIRETLRSEARVVMKATQFQSKIARALVTNADWHLIRDCPAPLWLVRGPEWQSSPIVAAFVDPLHEHDKPAELDRRILREGALIASRLGGELHAVHCQDLAADAANEVHGETESRLASLAAGEGVAAERVHLRAGEAGDAIPAATRDLRADLAVMGAVSRSRLEQAFIGNTAERVLDRVACDVLVIKPTRYQSPVAYRAQPADFMEMTGTP